ncbi:MAG: ATP-dependent helicase [Massiliimalia sp.]|jgi:DNA helicase-2/ATP-dependent DNA helicase PcrA
MWVFDYLEQHFSMCLNKQQKIAVVSTTPYILLLAVPGSGKTTVLVSRIAYLMKERQVPPQEILTLTFSRESAKDMKRRFERLFLPAGLESPRFSTIHSFCYTVLKYYASRYQRTFPKLLNESAGEASSAQWLRRIYQEVNGEYLSDDLLETLSNALSLSKNRMLTKEEMVQEASDLERADEVWEQYERRKKQHGYMDYDDLLVFTLDILKKVPAVRRHFLEKYRYILVDEAQDTSKVQFEILKLFRDSAQLFVVGDEDQCIYSFRGAYPEGLLEFGQAFPGAQILKIEKNYRSNQDIVEAANEFIKVNQNRYPKEMQAVYSGKASIEYPVLEDYNRQYEAIERLIRKLPPGETMAVLYRNHESAVPLLDRLNHAGISCYRKEHNLRFFTSFVVRDFLSFFTLAYDPKNLEAFSQIYYKCMCSKMVYIFVKYNLDQFGSVFEAAAHSPDAPPYVRTRMLEYHKLVGRIRTLTPVAAIGFVEEKMGYRNYLESRYKKSQGNPVNTNLKRSILKTVARNYTTIEEFVQNLLDLEQQLKEGNLDSKQSQVTLSSIHASKGLEWDHVVLIDLLESIFPSQTAAEKLSDGDREEMEGEARLFYVAVTRARKRLTIYTAPYCNDEYALKSRFVTRLHQEEWMEGLEVSGPLKGKKVIHKFFGYGVVTDHIGDTLDIYFLKYGVKQFSLESCLTSDLLQVLSDSE